MADRYGKPQIETVRQAWQSGLSEEINFWSYWISSKGWEWPADFANRLDPSLPLQDNLRSMIDVPAGLTIRILDVGSGPLTLLGKKWEGRTVEILAVDPLADEYDAMMAGAGVKPLVRARRGEAERLTELCPECFFDLSYAANCLDHCYDALGAIRQMLLVTRPGAFVHLEHAVNEAVTQKYIGLHQWNFCAEDGRFIIWRPDARIDATEALSDLASDIRVTAQSNWISVSIRRRSVTR